MSMYLVAFQVSEENLEQDYDEFYGALEEYDGYCEVFDNLWFVCSDGSAEDIHDDLIDCLYEGDFILVTKIGRDYHGYLPENVVDWVEENG